MAGIPGFLLRHTATVEPYLGAAAHGDTYGPAVTVRCFVDDARRRVRSQTGNLVTCNATLYCPVDTDIPTGSRITVNGRTAEVIAVLRRDGGGLSTPDHLEVAVT